MSKEQDKRIAELEAEKKVNQDILERTRIAGLEMANEIAILNAKLTTWQALKEPFKQVCRERDELEAELAEQAYIIAQFGEWYSNDGCPVTETKERFCPDLDGCRASHEKENLKLAEEDRFEFDSEDCETQINCGKCYAEYYRMKYRASLKTPTLPEPKEVRHGL